MSQSDAVDARHATASPRALQELAETVQRSRLGGPFYLLAWLTGGYSAELPRTAPLGYGLVALAFVAMVVARLRTRSLEAGASVVAVRQRLDWIWGVVLANAMLWGAAGAWLLVAAPDESARTVAAVCSYAFSTAFAHNFCMRRERALAAILALYLPTLAAYLAIGSRPEFLVIGLFYLAYVMLALRRSHEEYIQRLDLEDELRRQRDLFEQQSRRDGLTGLANRRHFADALERLVRAVAGRSESFALMILDLDHFKDINDRHGHATGDDCLREFAARLQRAFDGPTELVARLGGEEFGVLIETCDEDVAAARGEAFRQQMAGSPMLLPELAIGVTVSIGVGAFGPRHPGDADAFYQAVDQALYRAKAAGRDAVCRVTPLSD
jgi:diguanylate cyclase (GGDEF)-like protein